jgi:hypothetical protein
VNEVDTAIFNKLAAGTALTGLLAAGTASIFNTVAPQSAQMPYVVFARASDRDSYTLAAEATVDAIYTVKAVAKSPAASPTKKAAGAIAAQIKSALNDAPLSVTGKTWLSTRRESNIDYAETNASHIIYHVGGNYRLWIAP